MEGKSHAEIVFTATETSGIPRRARQETTGLGMTVQVPEKIKNFVSVIVYLCISASSFTVEIWLPINAIAAC